MARSAAARRPAPKAAPAAKGGMRPVLLAAGLGLFWFVEYQDLPGASDAPIWGYAMIVGLRLLADFVGAWVVIAALQLCLSLGRLGLSHLHGLWLQVGNR